MGKHLFEMNEQELREIAEKRKQQWHKAEDRVDKFYSLKCSGQANAYRQKYAQILNLLHQKGANLTQEEKSILSLEIRIVEA